MPDAPLTVLQVVQAGIETTPGTLVPATHRVNVVPGSVEIVRELAESRRRYSGSLATSHGAAPGDETLGINWDERLSYDRLAVLGSTFFAPTITGTGAGANKAWAFTPSDIADDLKRYSIEVGGKDTWPAEEKFAGCVGSSLTITIDRNEPWMAAVSLLGKTNTQAAKTASLTMPSTLVEILGRNTKVYIDPTTIGSTQYARVRSATFTYETGVVPRFGLDGNAGPNRLTVINARNVRLSAIIEYDVTTLRTAWVNKTFQKLRIEATGATLGSGTYLATLDVYGSFTSNPIRDDDGVTVSEIELVGEYDSTVTAETKLALVNSIAAIP